MLGAAGEGGSCGRILVGNVVEWCVCWGEMWGVSDEFEGNSWSDGIVRAYDMVGCVV